MGLLNLFRRDEVTLMRPEEREQALQEREELLELAESLDFNPNVPSDWKKLQRIKHHLDTGKEFCVIKLMNTPGGNRKYVKVGFLDYFPGYSDVVEMAEEKWGGGRYAACCWPDSSHLLKTWTLEGEPRTPPEANNGSKSQVNNIKNTLDAAAGEGLAQALEADPELKLRLGLAMIEKQLKVSLNGQSEDPIQNLINTAEQLRDLQTVLTGGSDSWKSVVADIGKSLGQPIVDLLKQSMAGGRPIPPVQDVQTTHVPAIAPEHHTAIRQPAEQDLSPVSGQVPLEHRENRVMGISSAEEEANTEVEGGEQIDWVTLLSGVDWQEVQARSQGDPGEFVQWAWTKAIQEQSQGHRMLVELFLNNEPRKIVETLGTGLQRLHEPMTVAFIKLAGKEKDLTTITDLLTPLLTTQGGVRWLVACRLGALEIAKRIDADQGEDDESVSVEEDGTGPEAARRGWLEESQQRTGEPVVTVPNLFGENGHVADDGRLM